MGILKSAFYSAKIEGNTLTIDEAVEHLNKLMAKSLPWRRYRILQIVRDHGQVSLDFIRGVSWLSQTDFCGMI